MGRGGGGGPCIALSPGLRGRGLGVQVWMETWTPGTGEWWVSPAVPGVQAGRVSSGHPAGHIDSRITGLPGTACLRFSTVVRTGSGKGEGTVSIAQLLLESSIGAYID